MSLHTVDLMIIVAYLVGSAILGRWAPKVARYKILPLLLGLVIYILLRAIPIQIDSSSISASSSLSRPSSTSFL